MTTQTWQRFWGQSVVRTPMRNGIGRYVQQLQRITFSFCKSKGSSKGMRDYVQKELINFANENPGVAVYLKPRRHHAPKVVAEYLNGEEKTVSLHNLDMDEIMKHVEVCRTSSGLGVKQLYGDIYSDHKSIQGPWTPWVHKTPQFNQETFPSDNLSRKIRDTQTGQDQILDLYERQLQEKKLNE